MHSLTLGLKFRPNRLPAELLDLHLMAVPNSSERRLISPHERPCPYRNSGLQELALISLNGMGCLSSTSAVLCDRALPCSVRASLFMPFAAA